MSSGSYFTLYRKYNVIPTEADLKVRESTIEKYVKKNRENSLKDSQSEEDLKKDFPLVLDPLYGLKESEYDEVTKTWKDLRDHSVSGQRKSCQKILASDGSHLDEILEWHFGSDFTCLKNEWAMNGYNWNRSQHIVDKGTAKLILQACNYLLSGNWSTYFEHILDNPWINILAKGNDSNSYWRYIYKNNKKMLRDFESQEDHDDVEWQLKQIKFALETYLNSEPSSTCFEDKVELMLVYSVYA